MHNIREYVYVYLDFLDATSGWLAVCFVGLFLSFATSWHIVIIKQPIYVCWGHTNTHTHARKSRYGLYVLYICKSQQTLFFDFSLTMQMGFRNVCKLAMKNVGYLDVLIMLKMNTQKMDHRKEKGKMCRMMYTLFTCLLFQSASFAIFFFQFIFAKQLSLQLIFFKLNKP